MIDVREFFIFIMSIKPLPQLYVGSIVYITSISQIRKQAQRDDTYITCGHTVNKWQSSNFGSLSTVCGAEFWVLEKVVQLPQEHFTVQMGRPG